jgi:hypothetical protein
VHGGRRDPAFGDLRRFLAIALLHEIGPVLTHEEIGVLLARPVEASPT